MAVIAASADSTILSFFYVLFVAASPARKGAGFLVMEQVPLLKPLDRGPDQGKFVRGGDLWGLDGMCSPFCNGPTVRARDENVQTPRHARP